MDSEPRIVETARDFVALLPGGGALLGLDLGTQTIGVATCDAGWMFATAAKTLARGKFGADAATLAELVEAFRLPSGNALPR